MRERYARAEALHVSREAALVHRASLTPVWEDGSFWYRVNTADGPACYRVFPETGERVPIDDPSGEPAPPPELTGVATSPGGRYAVTVEGGNLLVNGEPVTGDGEPDHRYAQPSDQGGLPIVALQAGMRVPPLVVWAPDGRRFATLRVDQRHVPLLTMTQSCPPGGGPRPLAHTLRYEMPGDPLPTFQQMIFDAETGARVDVAVEPLPFTHDAPHAVGRVWWEDDDTLWTLYATRGQRAARLYRIDARTGAAEVVLEEQAETFMPSAATIVEPPLVRTRGEEVLWYSARSGWGHLYLYAGGELRNAVTGGEWLVRDVLRVDWDAREVLFVSGGHGSDPYHRRLCRADLDGGGVTVLTPEDADHQVFVSPDGRWVVDTHAAPGTPPVTVLRDAGGAVVAELERADLSRLEKAGWRAPEPFTVKAADGETDLHGLLYLPGDFDPGERYPVLDSIYNGPQITRQLRTSLRGFTIDPYLLDPAGGAPMFAQLGLAVVVLDGRGTPYRSKAFQDVSYGDPAGTAGLDDHVAAIRQLAAERPYLDLSRVGIIGHSAGGAAALNAALRHPEFFTAAVASAGDHDHSGYYAIWGETYQGPPPRDYAAGSPLPLAGELRAKLLLLFGEMDDNCHPGLSLRVVDALVAADRDFEMLMVPNAAHGYGAAEPHVLRRQWDFLVRHLIGAQPPAGYRIAPASVGATS
ncbi:alpha/beta fold hydrolase [Nonomuraea pusilla]|uniref:Dipeptidyl aminopeptidase/acylaminoacyl peptidase n=1 Tax=Nonomuraea pusilla TaxID=46177 RepID=A0A1H7IAG0_9ACTN|nr:alpha/beta fold hydrolase [Nonomuraea pusilla]SEK59469.1 Dipeptidyl aminopeptidase/acylaminoacyl peptidase [Nonomuraea pusilla]